MAGIRRFIQNLTRQTEVQTRQAENTPVLRDSSPSSAPTEVTGVPISSLPGASTPGSNDVVPGVQSDTTKKFKLGDLLAWIKTQLSPADIGAVGASDVGVAGGVAELDANGKVPSAQLPAIPSDADEIGYDNTTSGLTATDVQTAIDEVVVDVGGKQPTITAAGILKGDGQGGVTAATAGTDYQAPLTIDATPTANSTNPVQSGGVYTDVRTRVPVYGMGKNLLDNWYFLNPVNQRGQSSYSTDGAYTIDRWRLGGAIGTASFDSTGVLMSSQTLIGNWVETSRVISGATYTISALWSNGLITATGTLTIGSGTSGWQISYGTVLGPWTIAIRQINANAFQFILVGDGTSKAIAAKLELGTEQTLAHQENGVWVLNDIPDYEYELYRCTTSTADPSDTYANKSLATEQQLAYVESGTTASRNYSAGEYICWNGLLYTANQAISSGTTLSAGTGGNLTECVGGGLNGILDALGKLVTNGSAEMDNYTVFQVILTDPWVQGAARISCVYVKGTEVFMPYITYTGAQNQLYYAAYRINYNSQTRSIQIVSALASNGSTAIPSISQIVGLM